MDYYRHYIGDFRRDTRSLSLLQRGAYRELMDEAYASELPLPREYEGLYRICGARGEAEEQAVREMADRFFPLVEEARWNRRVSIEVPKAQAAIAKQIASAAATNAKRDAERSPSRSTARSTVRSTGTSSNHQPPSSNHQPKAEKHGRAFALPEWVPTELWERWLKIRPARSNTDFALSRALGKLAKFREQGMDAAAVLLQSIDPGWRDLFPLKAAAAGKQSALEAANAEVASRWLEGQPA